MAKFDNVRLSVTQDGNWFIFTLNWTCSFLPAEADFLFSTWWGLAEEDDIYDDIVHSTVSPHLHNSESDQIVFKPKDSNPSNPRFVSFKETRQWHRDDVDTEWGGEEIYAFATLYNRTQSYQVDFAHSNTLNLSP
jgi:hypothetical protein